MMQLFLEICPGEVSPKMDCLRYNKSCTLIFILLTFSNRLFLHHTSSDPILLRSARATDHDERNDERDNKRNDERNAPLHATRVGSLSRAPPPPPPPPPPPRSPTSVYDVDDWLAGGGGGGGGGVSPSSPPLWETMPGGSSWRWRRRC